ncbi:MAG: HD domain-containing protein [Candidatus Omnitrophica bacterium]|nr:HD domain-containing protein [Candidatus Omnitrophota bacterium]
MIEGPKGKKKLMEKDNEVFLTPNQAAEILNVSLSTLKKFIYSGKIKTLKTPGGHHRIRKSDLFEMMNIEAISGQSGDQEHQTLLEVSRGLINLLERRQKFCCGHASVVCRISLKIGLGLSFSAEDMCKLQLAALLHDIGMLAIEEGILNKITTLSEMEYSTIKTHPALGADLISSVQSFQKLSPIIRQHHERYDGLGYPSGLKRDEICPEAKIVSLAEAFAAMTASDSYRKPLSEKQALCEIKKNYGGQFDPEITESFLKNYEVSRKKNDE